MSIQNLVKYTIFCNENINTNVLTFCTECKLFCDTFIGDYIWQKESFVLQPVEHQTGLPCLCGSTDFGENINDEWFIVFLLFELTKQFNGIVAQISDNDGEFLLIQAAEMLPSWIKPETSENRVFIHGGMFHIIPLPSNPAELTVYPTSTPNIGDAYKLVISENNTFASEDVQKVIFERIKGYPERISKEFHHAHCFIPKEIVHILQTNPRLVANAVQALYERDPIDINICHQMKHFQAEERMLTLVKFTRHLYGQLTQTRLLPHRNSKWRLPNLRDKLYKAAYLGYKLTCGFEILLARSTSADERRDDVDVNPSGRLWEQYLSNLKKIDYFQGELEGSKHYMELLEQAKCHFKNTFCSSSTSRTDEIGKQIVQLINDAKMKNGDINKSCEHLPDEDSEDWMAITPEELDKMMLNMWGTDYADKDKDQGNVENLSKLATSVKSFVDNVSSYEGAEMPIDNEDGDNDIIFDPNEFVNYIKELLDPPKYPSGCGLNNKYGSDDGFADGDSDSEIEDEFISCFKDGEVDQEMSLMMQQMDMELKESSVSQSFKATKNQQDATDDPDAPFDVDINLIENFVQSFSSQDGLAGPVSGILQSMGMNMPPDDGN